MIRKTLEPLVLLTLLASVSLCARLQRSAASAPRAAPDLLIAQLRFRQMTICVFRWRTGKRSFAPAGCC